MSKSEGFSADWLALREPADHAARNGAVQAAFLAHLASLEGEVRVIDLGCGAGSTLRALAPAIAAAKRLRQHWTLCDSDPVLLAEAERQVGDFLTREGVGAVTVDYVAVDLADGNALSALVTQTQCQVITGSALIDLVSAAWLDHVVALAGVHGKALLFALNYTGDERWLPAHPLDRTVVRAFSADMRRDKGFGAALGGEAVGRLARQAAAEGMNLTVGESAWLLDERSRALIAMLADGIAGAAVRQGVSEIEADDWARSRRKAESVRIGHKDVLALPR